MSPLFLYAERKVIISMLFVSERIINIAELENAISKAKFNFEILCDELKKETPSKEVLSGASSQVRQMLNKADSFEFCLEKRKSVITETSLNQK